MEQTNNLPKKHDEELKEQLEEALRTSERSRLALLSVLEDQKKTEESLRQSQERYRALIETQRDLITRWLPDTTLTYVNQAYCDFVGRKQEEILGKSWLFLLPEINREKFQTFYRELAQNPEINEYEHQATAVDGSLRWISWSEVPVLDRSGKLLEFQSVGREITGIKKAEALQRALYQISDAALGCRDLQQLYIQIHKTIAKLMSAENLYIAIYDPITETLNFPYYRDQKNDYNKPRKFGRGLTEYIITTQKPLLVNREVHDRLQREGKAEFVGQPSKQWLGVPLQSDNKTFGALVVQSYEENAKYTQKELELLNFVAGNVAVAILSIRAERELAESETRYRTFMNSATDNTYLKDDQLRYLMVNKAQEEFFGKTAEQILGKTDFDLMPNQAAQTCRISDQMVLERRQTILNHEQVGDKVYETRKFPVILGNGKTGVGAYIRDITERKRGEDQIRLASQKWETTFDSIGDGVCLLDRQWKVLQCNKAFAKMVNKPYAEVMGSTCYELVYGLKKPQEHCPVIRMEKSLHRETLEMVRDGKSLLITADPIFDENKNLIGAVHIISDITDRKLMEQELLQAQKMEAVGFLAGGVAHDFNNMLAGIVGNAELLQMKVYGQHELEVYVDNIIKASGHAASLTRQLLAFARKGQYQQVPVNIHKVIAETLGILGSTIDRRIKIEQHLKANPAVVLGDHSQLENALMNLGINARDAMPEGGKMIFSTEMASMDEAYILQHNYKIEPGNYIQITVEDTGSGMTDEVKRHLFEPFFTTKEKGRGTGLGLAGIYGCVKNHGGSIEVYSELGRGTAVKIYLPLYGEPADEGQRFDLPQDLTATAGIGSILIVDDENMIRNIAAQILKTAGYQVQTCGDGQEAVELYSKDHRTIDLVIMDMVMPKVDGREAFIRMKKINPQVKVLLSSGFSEDGDAQTILQEGALGFIQKPYRSAELLLRVQQALQANNNDQ